MEVGNLPEKEFRVVIIKMIKELGRRMDTQSEKLEVFNMKFESIKKNQMEMNSKITEMKNTLLEEINSTLMIERNRLVSWKTKAVEITEAEQKKGKRIKRNEPSLKDLWDNIKCTNIQIIGVPEGEESQRGREHI